MFFDRFSSLSDVTIFATRKIARAFFVTVTACFLAFSVLRPIFRHMTASAPKLEVNPIARHQQLQTVITRILDGMTLREAVSSVGLNPQLFNWALQQDREAALAYARAQEIRADMLADEVVAIADSDSDPAKVRNQMQARQWLASKLYAKRYGDRIDLNVTQTLDIGSTLAEARARLRPVSDQYEITDAQIIEAKRLSHQKTSDIKSILATDPCKAPNIFD